MGETIKRTVTVADNTYYVVGEENRDYRRVSVYDNSLHNYYPDNNDILYRKQRKALLCGWGSVLFRPKALDEMMKDGLEDAVEIFEAEQESQSSLEENVDTKLEIVKEEYDNK